MTTDRGLPTIPLLELSILLAAGEGEPMKASYFGCMGYAERDQFPEGWPVPPSFHDPEVSMRSYAEGMAECELAEELGFDWISLSEHHYSGNRTTPNPAVMAAAVAERCKRARIALLGQLLPLNNPIRAAEEIGMLDNLTGGRLVAAFMRGTPSEDQVYDLNPSEGRGRLMEAMDLVLKALTEPEPFSWEGRFYQYRTVSVWPWPVQRPLPPILVATRSDDGVKYAAVKGLGLGVSYEHPDDMAGVVRKYREWQKSAGWEPDEDQIVYRGGICLAETDEQAEALRDRVHAAGGGRGLNIGRSLAQAVQAARAGWQPEPETPGAVPQADRAGRPRTQLNFVGSPDTVVEQLRAYHDKCGVGVVDLAFQQPGLTHRDVMGEIELFGREVLPRMREF